MPNTSSSDPAFKPFSWLPEDIPYSTQNNLACLAHDIAFGVKTVLQLLELDYMDKCNQEPGLLRESEAGRLFRLAIVSAEILGMEAGEALARISKD